MFKSRKTGWLGIDVGTSTIKVVQLVRRDARLRISAKAIITRREPWIINRATVFPPSSSLEEMQAALSLMGEYSGRKAGAVLSMTLCGMHQVQQNLSKSTDPDAVIRQVIEMDSQRPTTNLQYDSWTPPGPSADPEVTNVLTMERPYTDYLCEDVAKLGLSCQLLDGMPLALARAVQLLHPSQAKDSFAAIDIGYGQTTFCAVRAGVPTYVRNLKGCSFQRVLKRLEEELDVTQEEAHRLLQEHSIAPTHQGTDSEIGEMLKEISQDFLESLVQETNKTLSHLKFQRPPTIPRRTYLFGGGATVLGLAKYLTREIQSPVAIWKFGDDQEAVLYNDPTPSCLFGPAIALSALAWEKK